MFIANPLFFCNFKEYNVEKHTEITFCGPPEENIPLQGSHDAPEMQALDVPTHLLIYLLHTPTLPRYKKSFSFAENSAIAHN